MDAITVFESVPGNNVLLKVNPPQFTIVAVSKGYEIVSGKAKEEVIGKGLFEGSLSSFYNSENAEQNELQSSLETIVTTKKPAEFLLKACKNLNGDGIDRERYLNITNHPILNKNGEVDYIIHSISEVPEQYSASKSAKENEQRYSRLFESMNQGFCVFEMLFDEGNKPVDYRFLEVNPVFESQTGLKNAVGKTARELVPNLESHWFDLYGAVALTGEPTRFVQGSQAMGRWFDVFAFRIGDDKSRKVALLFSDISDRKQAEEALRRSEQNLRNIIMQSPVAMCLYQGRDFVIDIANQKMIEFWGKNSADEVVNKPLFDALPETRGQGYEELMTNVMDTGVAFSATELPVTLHRNGVVQTVFINFSYEPLHDLEGKISGIMAIATDITDQINARRKIEEVVTQRTQALAEANEALKEANEYLQRIINVVNVPVQVLKPVIENEKITDFRFRLTNLAYAAYADTLPEKIQGKRVGEVFPGYFQTSSFTNVVKAFETGNPDTWEIHYNLDGLDIYNLMSATKMDDEVVVLFTDFTTLKSLQLELLQKIKELERSNAHLEEFAHAASHDLKEPIRKIRVFTEHLKMQLANRLNEAESKTLGRIESASERMGLLVDDLLIYSHVSQRPLETETVSLNDKIAQVLEDLELDIIERAAILQVGELPTIKGYSRQLQQLFQNLISNSLKYSKPAVPPLITISTHKVVEAGISYHVIQVTDNGIGFEQAYAEKIFNMFTRLHGKSEYSGTGIGLSIVKKVVENHSGFIRAEGKPGEGAAFNIYLPALEL